MGLIVFIPGLVSIAWCLVYSARRAFLDVYLPVMLLIPMTYTYKIQGLPEFSFARAAILPVAVFFILQRGKAWRFGWMDLVVCLYVCGITIAEHVNNGWQPAQNVLFGAVCENLLPYALAKGFFSQQEGFARQFARRMIVILFAVAMISVVEFRLGFNVFRFIWARFFPNAEPNIFVQYRWGFARIAGSFEHAIFAGLIFGIALLLHLWLESSGAWEAGFRYLPKGYVSKPLVLKAGLVLGLAMTISRGPWLALFCGLLAVQIARRGRMGMRFLAVTGALAIGFGALYIAANHSKQDENDSREDRRSMAYRANLFERYEPALMKHLVEGYGTITWPKADDMPSVDNAYLHQALCYGLLGLCPLALMLLLACGRLIFTEDRDDAERHAHTLRFALMGVLVCFVLNFSTVYMGNQSVPLLFFFTGAIEGHLLKPRLASRVVAAGSWVPVV